MSHSQPEHTSHRPHPLGRDPARLSRMRHRWPHPADSGHGKPLHKPALPPCGLRTPRPACRIGGHARMEIAEAPAPQAVPDGGPPPAGWIGRRWLRGHSFQAADRTRQSAASRGIGPPRKRRLHGNRIAYPIGLRPGKGNRRHHLRSPARGVPAICPESFGAREPRSQSAATRPAPSRRSRQERRMKYRCPGRPARSSPSDSRHRHRRSRDLFWRPS